MVPDPLLPDWVPNAHPLIVHFPIALLFMAVVADAMALWLGDRWDTGQEVATALFACTGLSAVVTYYSGTWALDTVTVTSPEAVRTLATHSLWGWYTMLATGGYALMRGALLFVPAVRTRRLAHAGLFVAALGTFFPMWKAGENGGKMVYRHGVGVTQIQEPAASPPDSTQQPPAADSMAEER